MKRCALLAFVALAACSQSQNDIALQKARAHIKAGLKDPASAEFQNEQVRTLWATDGSRKTIYCAQYNANNSFGGKTGFKSVEVIINNEAPAGVRFRIAPEGSVFTGSDMDAGLYRDCVRRDTQRKDHEAVFLPVAGPFDSAQNMRETIDREWPVISMDEAPKK